MECVVGPDFICIGAPKAGTTWLYSQVKRHPDIWVPIVKELRYFDRKFPIARVMEKKGIKRGLLGAYRDYSRILILRSYKKALLERSFKDMIWVHRYLSGELTDQWYCSLFDDRNGYVKGELTTDYCALSEEAVGHIHDLLPYLKIILLIRDPVERAWSHARMLLPDLLGKKLENISEQEFIDYLRHPAAKQKGMYSRILEVWEKFYINTNYAWIDSEITLSEKNSDIQTSNQRPLQGQSPYVWNFQLGYDDEDRDINAALLFNIFGERIVDVGVNGAPDILEQPRPSLDFVYSHGFDQWKLKAKIKNILDPDVELTQGGETTRITQVGREFSIALQYGFR